MENILQFFAELPNHYKLLWVLICLSISWLLEFAVPLVQLDYRKWRHAGVNLIFFSTSLIINVLFGLATVGIFLWTGQQEFGLFYLINLPVWVELLLAIMILDFIAQYVAHYLLHRVAWMWKFHLVHHSDTKVDATTGTRHHPGDYFIRELFALAAILITGMPVAFYIIYRITSILFTYFSHANIGLPTWLDKMISTVFITPNMHKFHHHFERPWTDSNFGNIFSFWDRLFGTLVYGDPLQVQYGVDVVDPNKSEDVLYQFKLPFDSSIKTD